MAKTERRNSEIDCAARFNSKTTIRLSMLPTMLTWTSLRCGSPKSAFIFAASKPFGVDFRPDPFYKARHRRIRS